MRVRGRPLGKCGLSHRSSPRRRNRDQSDGRADRFAILGGDDTTRVVPIVSCKRHGTIVQQYGVTREADSIASRADGTVFLGLSTADGGAVEEWSPKGRRLRTIPLPVPVVAMNASGSGAIWALGHRDGSFAAFEIGAANRTMRSVPLPAGSSSLAYCDGTAQPSLVVSETGRHVTLVRIRDGATTDTTDVRGRPVVFERAKSAIYAITRAGDATYLSGGRGCARRLTGQSSRRRCGGGGRARADVAERRTGRAWKGTGGEQHRRVRARRLRPAGARLTTAFASTPRLLRQAGLILASAVLIGAGARALARRRRKLARAGDLYRVELLRTGLRAGGGRVSVSGRERVDIGRRHRVCVF